MIRILDKQIADKIAAGEVIERPVSIIKELVENSIDAGADSIVVEIKKGGKSYIRVTDNGCGIARDEVEKAFLRHATSKIETVKDLEAIETLGFRGEALASVCAVTRTELLTKRPDDKTGTRLIIHGGEIISNMATGCPDGTTIIITLKDDTDDENYSKYLEEYEIRMLVKRYSDYIRYPIKMMVTESELVDGTEDEYETITTEEVLNTMSPLWKKNKSEVTSDEYNQFYKDNFYDFNDPLRVIHSSTEGAATYNALLFVPSKAPFNYYSKDFEKGLKLYASGVLIMDCCKDLLPDYFSFVRGLVDSADLSLNISREMLQQDRQLQVIAKHLEKKIKSELLAMLRNDREKYEEFWKQFGMQIKFGIYSGFGMNTELLKDLVIFYSSYEKKYTTLEDYIARMPEEQKYIYYACGDNVDKIEKLPQAELVMDKGYEILFLTDDVDEFTVKAMHMCDGKEFRSISDDDLGLETDAEKDEQKKKDEENKELFDFMKDALAGKVATVKASHRLKSHPVCLSTEGGISLEMEKVFAQQPNAENRIKASRVLEINTDHKIFTTMTDLYASASDADKEKVKTYTDLLYNQALLIEGMPIDDPVAFANAICELM